MALSKYSTGFGLQLRRLRLEEGFSLRSLAKRVAVDFSYLSKIENGVLPPPAAATIDKLARALGYPANKLLQLARKVPKDLSGILLENEHLPVFLRAANRLGLSEQDWEELLRLLAERRHRTASAWPERFSDSVLADRLLERITMELPPRRLAFVQMCGTRGHTLVRAALGHLMDGRIRLIANPGSSGPISGRFFKDAARLASRRDVQLLACRELMLEPKLERAVQKEMLKITTVASPQEAVRQAAHNPERKSVLLAAGFETTVPPVALAAIQAEKQGIQNIYLLTSLRSMLAAFRELARRKARRIDGMIAPGHVSAIVGLRPLRRIAREHRLPIVIAGFETVDILCALLMLVRQIRKRQATAQNQYGHVVQTEGNPAARRLMAQVFQPAVGTWEGLGKVPNSLFHLRPEYRQFDAALLLE